MQYRKVENCDQLLEEDPKIIQSQLIDYIISLREENKLSATTINTKMSAIKKPTRFYLPIYKKIEAMTFDS
jgi:hypothetical protein